MVLGSGQDGRAALPDGCEAQPDGRADQTLYAQAGLFAVQAGLVALLAAAGITPDAVAGHSVGEVGAAYAAGVLSLEDACALVATRARLMQGLPSGGAMCAIQATEAEVTEALAGVAGVSIAAVNGPASVVISGDAGTVDEIAERFRGDARRVRRLHVSHAFHSHRMDPVLAELGQVAAGLAHAAPRVPWAGALAGELVAGPGPGYWVAQARRPVRFADAVAALAAGGVSVFWSWAPDGTLLPALGPAALPEGEGVFVPLLRADQPGPAGGAGRAGPGARAWRRVDWAAVLAAGQRVDLPTYAFQRERYWPRAAVAGAGDVTAAGLAAVGHPLLGAAVELAGGGGLLLTGRLSVRSQPWLADHAVAGSVLLPGTAFVEMAVQAADAAGCGRVAELTLAAPLVLPADSAVQLQVVVGNRTRTDSGPSRCTPRPVDAGGQVPWTAARPPGCSARPRATARTARPSSRCGHRKVPSRWTPGGSTRSWRRAGTGTARRSAGCARRGGAGRTSSPTCSCRRPRPPTRPRSVCTPPCSTPRCTRPGWPSAGGPKTGQRGGEASAVRLPFAWTGVSLHAAGAAALRVRLRCAAGGSPVARGRRRHRAAGAVGRVAGVPPVAAGR